MPTFKYRARLADGRIQAGMIEADTQEAAQAALDERNAETLLLEPYTGVDMATRGVTSLLNRVTPKDLVVVSRTLSVMVSASVPLTEAIDNISRQTQNPKLRAVLVDVAREVEGGARLSDALERHPKIFSGFFVNMVRSGESSGQLDQVLEYLADQQEKDYDLAAKIKGAMIYPAFIISAMFIVGFIMMTFVVPKLVSVLQEANVALPLSTRILIAVSGFFERDWWLILSFLALAALGFRAFIQTPSGRYSWDLLKLRLPVFGKLFQGVYVVRFSRSLATLVKGGVDVVTALEIVSGVMENEVWKRLVLETIREVNDGNSVTTALERSRYVPRMMVQMLAVGENTGRTADILVRLSSFYSREIDNLVANLVALIEPAVLILLGIGVGALVSAILLPLYQLSTGV
jgi:type IV pilus assembly protein PilC